jgi:hypothetical protein
MARETAAEKAEREAAEQAQAAVDAAAQGLDVDPGEGAKVRVPASVGETITFSRGGDVVAEFAVKDGLVTAKDAHERQLLLSNVAGAELVED